MKMSSDKPTLSFKIFLALLLLPVVICIVNGLYEVISFDKEKYVISYLEKRYYGEFTCIGKAENNNNGKTETFYLKSSLRPDLTITATYWEGWNDGPMSVVPFNLDYQRRVGDNYFKQLLNETVDRVGPIDISEKSVETTTDIVYSTMQKIRDLELVYVRPDVYVDTRFNMLFTYHRKSKECLFISNVSRKRVSGEIYDIYKELGQYRIYQKKI